MRAKILIPLIMTVFAVIWCLPAPVFAEQKQKPVQENQAAARVSTPDTAVAGSPGIFFPETTFDFGEADQLTTLTHNFKVINKGDAPLKITKVRAS